ncbi:hypothetical protein CAPTEDRAFT_185377 [Capitella teleta]|uniref:Uncharacterized protein n=1 Tax=Capitella teleta TaxID=283909 RepID=R7TBH2_CAPTE|nr:hypothetical protein CAPTEDRAFT_185377 [Capitella teleta]|eukprot:ELT90807.1 hypothetical protein CAPTEDRAFT_185377 [Capitella teleta]
MPAITSVMSTYDKRVVEPSRDVITAPTARSTWSSCSECKQTNCACSSIEPQRNYAVLGDIYYPWRAPIPSVLSVHSLYVFTYKNMTAFIIDNTVTDLFRQTIEAFNRPLNAEHRWICRRLIVFFGTLNIGLP